MQKILGAVRQKKSWIAVVSVFAAFVSGLALVPALGKSGNCITDTELETAVGDQIRSGVFAINTSKLREAPMCSGLTVAQAIHNLGERIAPRQNDAGASSQPALAQSAPAGPSDSAYSELTQYVGKKADFRVRGHTFLEHPLLERKLQEIDVDGPYSLIVQTGSAFTRMEGHVLVNGGCFPENCKTNYHRLFLNTETGAIAVCYVGGQWSDRYWFSTVTRGEWLEFTGSCPESYRTAPPAIRKSLEARGASAPSSGMTAQNAAANASSLAQLLIGNWEVTDPDSDPGRCISKKNEVQFALTTFKPGGRVEFIGQDGGGAGTWSVSGNVVRETIDGQSLSYTVSVLSPDHLHVKYNIPNGGTESFRRCPW
ncbi:lipocalin family protein [Tsuneonella sp. CC-YZS046]|uniref:lipocalin family protein n=1 Tax=Tsuneonella sp. CC-YZS046 TaxID=3042152 RepID=UPI002D79A1BE|nr:lipocalin family protein [Tsuneonella sp. CC-YZS046]WRO67378.1 lipocalin family protein [Tsuneonella sp. CC-YZS046]